MHDCQWAQPYRFHGNGCARRKRQVDFYPIKCAAPLCHLWDRLLLPRQLFPKKRFYSTCGRVTNGWYVALEGSSSGIPLSCQLAKSDGSTPSRDTFGIAYDSHGLLVWVRKDDVDPIRDPELMLSVDGHSIGRFPVDTVLVNPNIQAMIGARLSAFQQRPLLAALGHAKRVEIKTNTFVLQFDLAGIDTAIKQLFECTNNLPR